MKKRLLLLSFAEGGVVMIAEICGARLLAPVFGSSLYVWASVMGITLGALAAGYFFGGQATASQGSKEKKLFMILNIASMLVLVMPLLSYYLVPRISYLPFMPGVVISTFTILFLPVFLLGASSPLFIELQVNPQSNAGKVSGTIYAVSTAGGIVATFLAGFYLIPAIGLHACLLSSGIILFLLNMVVFKKLLPFGFFIIIVALYFNYQKGSASNVISSSDGIMGQLKVSEYGSKKNGVRYLSINGIIQTEMNLGTRKSVSEYIRMLDTLVKKRRTRGRALVLGLGGGLTSNLLEDKNYATDGVEFDGRIIDVARESFFLSNKVTTIESDARFFLNHCDKKYDIILADIFKAEEQPSHVLTFESLVKLKGNLAEDGLLIVNWHGYLNSELGQGSAILNSTLKAAGYKVGMVATSGNEHHRNILFVASQREIEIRYKSNEHVLFSSLVNTDDRPLLERYNAGANKTWRANYLRFYQSGQVSSQ